MNRIISQQSLLNNTNLTASNSYLKIANIDELITDDIDIHNITSNKASINNITSDNIETKEIETDEIILKNNRLKTSTNNIINVVNTNSTLLDNSSNFATIGGNKTFSDLRTLYNTFSINGYTSKFNVITIPNQTDELVNLSSNQTLTNKIINSSTGQFDPLLTTTNIGIGCLNPANNEILKRNLILDENSSVSDYQLNLTGDGGNGRCAGIGFTITDTGSTNGMTWVYPNHTPGGSIIFERTGSWSIGIMKFFIKNITTETGTLTNTMNLYSNRVEVVNRLNIGESTTTTLNFIVNDAINDNGQFFIDLRDVTYNRLRSTQSNINNSKDLMISAGTGTTTPNIYIVSSNNRVGINKSNPDEILDVNGNIKCDDLTCVNLTISKPLILTDLTIDNLTINKPLILTEDLTCNNLIADDILTTNLTSINGNINDLIIVNGFANTFTITNLTSTNVILSYVTINKPLILTEDLTCNNLTINKPLILTEDLTCNNLTINKPLILTQDLFTNVIYGGNTNNTNLTLRGSNQTLNNGKILIDQNDVEITFGLQSNNIDTNILNVNLGAVIEEAQIKNININNSIITTNNTDLSIRRNNSEKIRIETNKTILIDTTDITNINIGNSIIGTNDANNLSIRRNNSEKISVGNSFIRMFESLIVGGSSTTTLNFVINDSILGNGQFFVDLRDVTYTRIRSTQSNINNSKDLMITAGTTATTPNIYIVSSNNRVGINKNNPDEILDVNGNIKSNGAIINNIDIGSNIIGTNNNNDLSIRRNNVEYIKLITLSGGITRSDIISDRCYITWVLTPRINTEELIINTEDINFDDPDVDSYIKKNGTNRRIIFGTSSQQRLLINCSSTYSSGNYFQLNSSFATDPEYIYFSNGRNFGMWKTNVGRVWRFFADGELECLSLSQYSDIKIKKNIELVKCCDSLDRIKNINVYKFNYIDEKNEDKKHIGVIANEVEEYVPEIIKTINTQYKGISGDLKNINTTELNYLLLNCVKELKNEIDNIKNILSTIINI